MTMDYKQFEDFNKQYKNVLKNFNKFISDFLFEQGMRALRKTKLRTPVDTGALRNAWNLNENVYRRGKELYVIMHNPLNYASFIEYGHTKPGRVGWVDGYFMATVSIQEVQDAIPERWNKAFKNFVANLKGIDTN